MISFRRSPKGYLPSWRKYTNRIATCEIGFISLILSKLLVESGSNWKDVLRPAQVGEQVKVVTTAQSAIIMLSSPSR